MKTLIYSVRTKSFASLESIANRLEELRNKRTSTHDKYSNMRRDKGDLSDRERENYRYELDSIDLEEKYLRDNQNLIQRHNRNLEQIMDDSQ